ncbi:3'-5' exoribonuclease [Candidatus Arthromitus sp. SFB-mouse-Japan]|uniref:3'-5' exoribonuclease YhaM family protein n=1 Tax=unclassified Candidatus Neoarthromitus TaxID=2638829 RepID=UPI00021B7FE1|nr:MULTISPECIES: HD domain-containing protein [unclassified Candidatus Arthromitus]EIA31457.1 3'-5' exoribonuclease YhaM [Candidatus Arthromitus sp. SFB-mouse-SU]AID43958.1 3'->5' exoribonuclease [Candidatus Arthromitus sp. SFB-mouse-NL]EGX28038.1 3'-5' exoribonuclease [Candidatus Arthromitus sp. SFB-mouse-NYU]BAK55796.1 3'-5' exoribonuclease [Candidatus Arthromitus sp. SFB-mouse-Japan]BAK79155.1 3'-5' exoribonuclease YhaM [Candidatus Arthromitus sp. SFB-mouse-Yit]
MKGHINIKDFKVGERIQGVYLIRTIHVKLTNSSNKKYLDINFSDKTGNINAKLWDLKDDYNDEFKENTLVKVKGCILSWQGSMQLKIENLSNDFDKEYINIDDYVQCAPMDSNYMFDELYNLISGFKQKEIRSVLLAILDIKKDKLLYYPAAKSNHHSIKGGLLYHILSMIKLGESICGLYPFVNRELLFAGIVLHDIEKTEEMDSNELGIVSTYTVEGQMLSHLIQGITLVDRVCNSLNISSEVRMLLQHMILSHHYEAEYGSPIKPMIIEGELLHHIDVIDARMYDMKKIIDNINEGDLSDRVFSLNSRRIYKPKKLLEE